MLDPVGSGEAHGRLLFDDAGDQGAQAVVGSVDEKDRPGVRAERLDHAQMDTFRLLCQRHKQAILDAKFDTDYFRTLEEFVLFFIYHDIRAVWVAGALKNVISESMARLYDRNDSSQRRILFTLLDFMALELSQVQRVYIRHAEYQEIASPDPTGLLTRST